WHQPSAPAVPYLVASCMTHSHAVQAFTSQDDPVFSDVDPNMGRRVRHHGTSGGTALDPGSVKGAYSWFLTVSPKAAGAGSVKEFVVSVVVCHKRTNARSLAANNPKQYDLNQEREVNVDLADFYDGGLGGGSVRINWTSTTEPLDQQIYDVKADDWVMLYGRLQADDGNGGIVPGALIAQWYRVIATDDSSEAQNGSRELTLQGGDWFPEKISTGTGTKMVIMDRVIGVYEKTVKIE
ncbi:MAG: hypothetical protein N2C14_12275, partial [Planctomycetales bacterium]